MKMMGNKNNIGKKKNETSVPSHYDETKNTEYLSLQGGKERSAPFSRSNVQGTAAPGTTRNIN
jgi:hypothetical protein